MNQPLDIEDANSLLAYLRETGRIGADETPRVRVLAGGVSNKTVLVERASGEAWVLKQALAKLRVATDWFSDPTRIQREAEALRWLPRFAPAGTITPLVFEDAEHNLLASQEILSSIQRRVIRLTSFVASLPLEHLSTPQGPNTSSEQ